MIEVSAHQWLITVHGPKFLVNFMGVVTCVLSVVIPYALCINEQFLMSPHQAVFV